MENNKELPEKVSEMEWSLQTNNGKPTELTAPLEVSEPIEDDEATITQPAQTRAEPIEEQDSDSTRLLHIRTFLENELKSAYSVKSSRKYDGPGSDIMEGQRLATISVLKKLLVTVTNGYSPGGNGNGSTSNAPQNFDEHRLSKEKASLEKSLEAWQAHCEALTKERNAMQSIMESKVAMLVDKVSSSVGDILRSIPNKDPRATQLVQKV